MNVVRKALNTVTAETVRSERDATGDGMMQCRDRQIKAALLSAIQEAAPLSPRDMTAVLVYLVERNL